MKISLKNSSEATLNSYKVFLISDLTQLNNHFTNAELDFLNQKLNDEKQYEIIFSYPNFTGVVKINQLSSPKEIEKLRVIGKSILSTCNEHRQNGVEIIDLTNNKIAVLALTEGIALSNYSYQQLKKASDKQCCIDLIEVNSNQVSTEELTEILFQTASVHQVRDWVNTPLSQLNATELSQQMSEIAHREGITIEILHRDKIETLRMGGLLGVNKGCLTEPLFVIAEYKHPQAKNSQPIVLVGKGIVYDTGGSSLKPSNSMEDMKDDMAGAATVFTTLVAAKKCNLPIHLIALIPMTENRLAPNSLVPGDVITMFTGTTVEVMNTDAEGRLILADALGYAKRLNPELVIDLATLTGSAVMALGYQGIPIMGTASSEIFNQLLDASETVYERCVRFPLWEEYAEGLKSEIADMKNVAGREGGAITAGKFLEHFTEYPWIHLDIAGPAFLTSADGYKPKGGTGFGVRLLIEFLKKRVIKN